MIGLIQILGGLALFMFGVRQLSGGMEKLAGERIQQWLRMVTADRLRSALFGATATAFLQSSGLLMVTMIGLINANVMSVTQAIGIMLGQEIGATVTAQIVVFDVGAYRLLLVVAGYCIMEFLGRYDWRKYGEILFGIGLIFIGIEYMKMSLDHLTAYAWFERWMVIIGERPLLGIVTGFVVTSLIHSSTAVSSLAVAMGIQGAITLPAAIGIILGANIGSCVTGFLASLGQSHTARQASTAQILINLCGTILFIPFIEPYGRLLTAISSELPRQIANAHTFFNLTMAILLMPFVRQLAWLAARLTPRSKGPQEVKATAYIDERQLAVPSVALAEATRELIRVAEATAVMVSDACNALKEVDLAKATLVEDQERTLVDPVYKALTHFINLLLDRKLTRRQQQRCFQIKNLLVDVERIGDMAEDIAGFARERLSGNVTFTAAAEADLDYLWQQAHATYLLAIEAYSGGDVARAEETCRMESAFDHSYAQMRQAHIQRLEQGGCEARADVIFTETLRMLERISDHADNLAVSVIRSSAESGRLYA